MCIRSYDGLISRDRPILNWTPVQIQSVRTYVCSVLARPVMLSMHSLDPRLSGYPNTNSIRCSSTGCSEIARRILESARVYVTLVARCNTNTKRKTPYPKCPPTIRGNYSFDPSNEIFRSLFLFFSLTVSRKLSKTDIFFS